MTSGNSGAQPGAAVGKPEQDFVITRVFDAPRELVWRAFTQPEHLTQWWGPKGFTMQVANLDLRPGGMFHYGMRAPNGMEMWGKITYRELTPPERMVLIVTFSDANGGLTRHPMSATWPLEVLNTVTLAERDGKTTLTLRATPLNATADERKTFVAGYESMQKGFGGTFDQLAEHLAQM